MRPFSFKQLSLMAFLLVILMTLFVFVPSLFRQFNPGIFALVVALVYIGTALNRARQVVSPPRFPLYQSTPAELGLPDFEEVTFPSRDGLQISGWYIPSKNGAAVIFVHSWGGSRASVRLHARPLIDAGYGALLFDLRAHSRSQGVLSTWGWQEVQDVEGAYDFLCSREEVDSRRIGLAGVSLGAQIAIRAAVSEKGFAAVWADGPIPVSRQDHGDPQRPTLRQRLMAPWYWLAYRTMEWLTEEKQPIPLLQEMPKVSPRPLFVVASGKPHMIRRVKHFYNAASEPKELWQMDEVPFGAGVVEKGDDYDLKIANFFNQTISDQNL